MGGYMRKFGSWYYDAHVSVTGVHVIMECGDDAEDDIEKYVLTEYDARSLANELIVCAERLRRIRFAKESGREY